MAVPIRCPGCGFGLSVTEETFGRKIRCRKCGEIFLVDPPEDDEVQPVAAAAIPKSALAANADSSSRDVWIVVVLLLGLLLVGGGAAGAVGYVLLRKPAPAMPKAVAEDGATIGDAPAPQAAPERTEPTKPLKPNAPGKDGQLAK